MSTAEYTITLHNTDNSARRSSAEKSAQTAQERTRELFREWYEKYIIAITTTVVILMTFIYSVFSIERIEYLPSALILMITLGVISYLLEKDGERNG